MEEKYSNLQWDQYDPETMKEIELFKEDDLDYIKYLNEGIRDGALREVRYALLKKLPIDSYIKEGYIEEGQIAEIRLSLEDNIELKPYVTVEMLDVQLEQIRLGLLAKVDVGKYNKIGYNWMQMREIRIGLEKRLDVDCYASEFFSYQQMQEIKKGLEEGIDVSPYAKLMYSLSDMRKKHEEIKQQSGLKTGNIKLIDNLEKVDNSRVIDNSKKIEQDNVDDEIKAIVAAARKKVEDKQDGKNNDNPAKAISKDVQLKNGDEDKYNIDMRLEKLMSNEEKPCEIIISLDKTKAYMFLNPPIDGKKYPIDVIINEITSSGIIKGISENAITDAVNNCRYNENILIASATMPTVGTDGYYEFFFKEHMDTKPKIQEDGSVDYNDLQLFEMVDKDQLIARYHKATAGVAGTAVDGEVILALSGRELPILRGKGIRVSEDGTEYFSNEKGSIEKKEYMININKVLEIKGDVRQGTGRVNFEGDVVIKGNVCSGMRVEATNNVVIFGVVEAATIKCGGTITVKAGVLGNQTAVLQAKKSIYCIFIENANISTGADLYANYLLGSVVSAANKIYITGKKGSIIGGYTYAGVYMEAFSFGNKTNVKTILEVGINDAFEKKEYDKVRQMQKIMDSIKELVDCKSKFDTIELDEGKAKYYSRVCQALDLENSNLDDIENDMQVLKREKDRLIKGKIIVKYIMYPGCLVKVNGKAKKIDETLKKVCIKQEDNAIQEFEQRRDKFRDEE